MTDESTLLSDQVFQLNTFLWALEDLPTEPVEGETQPVLRQAGYYLGAIGRRVIMPSDDVTRAALTKLTGAVNRAPCHPDLWLRHATDPVQPLVELKAHGFSPESSKRKQALKLIAAASDLAPSLAETEVRPGHVVYATVASDVDKVTTTLRTLAQELRAEGVDPAPIGAIGLAIEDDGVVLSSPDPADLPEPLEQALTKCPIVLHRDGDNDLRPLYFIPWIPGIKESQDAELHSDGLRELTARVLVHMLAAVGQTQPPATLILSGSSLLSDATFGVADRWLDTDRREFRKAVARIVDKTLKSVVAVSHLSAHNRQIDLPDIDTKGAVIERIEQADPADPSVNLQAITQEPLPLFDEP